ncbi:MAG: universal stress protein [Burkholderiaceae bacterium]
MTSPFARLLLATEHTEHDRGAEALAFALARRCALPLAGVMPLVSNAEFEAVAPQIAARDDSAAAAKRSNLEDAARAQGVALAMKLRHGPELYAEIVAEARECAADLIIIRPRGRRGLLANLLVGEMVHKVVAHAPCSVLTVPSAASMWSRRVLVGVDPAAPDAGSLQRACAIAAECAVPLQLVGVAPDAGARTAAERALATALQQARAMHTDVEASVRVGRAHHELLAAARECGADLMVVARHGGDSLSHAWIGGTAQKVIGLAECPVLVCVPAARPAP